MGWAKLTLLLLRCVFLSLCANVSLQILLKLHLEHVNIATVCCRNRKKKTPDAQSPKKAKPKAMLDPSPPSAHPCSSSGYAFFYDFALFRSIFPYIYFACNSFPFIFTCKSAKYWYIFLLFCQRICLGFAGDCFWVLFFLL